jgi:two-component system alkaline phosphatase synthesis response regulator PhoP
MDPSQPEPEPEYEDVSPEGARHPAGDILVVDDDRDIARLARAYLEQAGFRVRTAYDGEAALHAIRRQRPDLLVLDLMMPGRDGWSLTRLLRADESLADLPIVMVTARIADEDKIDGLELGADDYITKPFNPRVLVARVKAVLRRGATAVAGRTVTVLRWGALALDSAAHTVHLHGELVDLTPTERMLLEAFLRHPGQAMTRTQLIESALGHGYEGMERTLDTHIKNLRRKLEADPTQPQMIQTVFGVGYRMPRPGETP